jgi:hypothetical protein
VSSAKAGTLVWPMMAAMNTASWTIVLARPRAGSPGHVHLQTLVIHFCLNGNLHSPWIARIDPSDVDIQTLVNGKVMQKSSTYDLIFDVLKLVQFISGVMTLEPGDVIGHAKAKRLRKQPNSLPINIKDDYEAES